MKLTSKTTYTTTIITVEYGDEEYVITHSDDFDDVFVSEWQITNIDGDDVDPGELFDQLKEFAVMQDEDQGPEYDSAGFAMEDR